MSIEPGTLITTRGEFLDALRSAFAEVAHAGCREIWLGERLRKSTDDRERRAQLVRHVGDKIAAHDLQAPQAREVQQCEHGAAARQRPRGNRQPEPTKLGFDLLGRRYTGQANSRHSPGCITDHPQDGAGPWH